MREALEIAADAAEALADLHGIGTAHGDVKPQNLVVDASGRAHAIDLGLCCAAFSTDLAGATARYLAAEDADLGDARARDLLALGVVLAERSSPAVRHAREAVAAARAAILPAPLDEICGALLARSPTSRPSARWVADAAIAALSRLGAHARPGSKDAHDRAAGKDGHERAAGKDAHERAAGKGAHERPRAATRSPRRGPRSDPIAMRARCERRTCVSGAPRSRDPIARRAPRPRGSPRRRSLARARDRFDLRRIMSIQRATPRSVRCRSRA